MSAAEPQLYSVVVDRQGPTWRLRMEDEGLGQPAEALAQDLEQAERLARQLVAGRCDAAPDSIDVDLDLRLPEAVLVQLNRAEQLAEEATMEIEGAIVHLESLGVSVPDIGRILRRRGQSAPSPLTTEHSPDRHPKNPTPSRRPIRSLPPPPRPPLP